MRSFHPLLLGLSLFAITTQGQQAHASPAPAASEAVDVEAVLAGIDGRIEAMWVAERGDKLKRAKKRPPLRPGRPPFLRNYSASIVTFAGRCFHLNEQLDEANAALIENAQPYLEIKDLVHDRDSFHWHGEMLLRYVEMYGANGHVAPGRLSPEAEMAILETCWLYGKGSSWLGKTETKKSKTWHLYSTENHHSMDFAIHWHFAKIAKDHPDFKDRRYGDGSTPEQQYEAYNDYFVQYALERARRGICVEMRSDGYNTTTIKGFYNFYDYGQPHVREAARMLLDLYFAYWAEEQIQGHMGGGKSRIRGTKWPNQFRDHHGNTVYAWVYFGIGNQPSKLSSHKYGMLFSSYRPPAVVADIAVDHVGRGTYEVKQRVQGLGKEGNRNNLMSKATAHEFRLDGGGIVRYSYCDPAFIMGCVMHLSHPADAWIGISGQSRWQGVVFEGEHDPRIVPLVRPTDNRDSMNASWSVQSQGAMITHKLKESRRAEEMMVWICKDGLSTPVQEDGVVFVEAPGAYAAVRPGWGPITMEEKRFGETKPSGAFSGTPFGYVVTPEDDFVPMIVEVMSKEAAGSFDAFRAKVKATRPHVARGIVTYTSIYGDTLTLDTNYRRPPSVNGVAVDYDPPMVYDSPFKHAEYLSGVVTIEKGDRKLVLDFNKNVAAIPRR
ncbi:MAG: hypothetical protein AAF612_08060 [Planctomycetota bacterium]